jgi:hypothetical protein
MQIAIRIRGTVIVDNNINTFNVNATPKNICRNQYAFLERLESGVAIDTGQSISRASNKICKHTAPLAGGQSEC